MQSNSILDSHANFLYIEFKFLRWIMQGFSQIAKQRSRNELVAWIIWIILFTSLGLRW